MPEPLTLSDINDLRSRLVNEEKPLSDEEVRDAVAALRADRMNAKPQQRGKKAAATGVSLLDLETGPDEIGPEAEYHEPGRG